MEKILELEKRILYPYFKGQIQDPTDSSNSNITKLLELVAVGSYVEVLKTEECQIILKQWHTCDDLKDSYTRAIKEKIEILLESGGIDQQLILLVIGVSCLQIFVQNNFTGPLIGPSPLGLLYHTADDCFDEKMHSLAVKELVLDTEGVYSLIVWPEYLLIARVILNEIRNCLPSSNSVNWWCCRYNIVHQKVVDEKSPLLYDSICQSITAMEQSPLFEGLFGRELEVLFQLEIGHIHLHYYRVDLARSFFNRAQTILDVEVTMIGALGKRTKWQEKDVAQLVVKFEYKGNPITDCELEDVRDTLLPMDLPQDLLLSDDTRLHSINYKDRDEDIIPNLQPIEQAYLLAGFFLMSKASASTVQLELEMKAYLHSLLQYSKNWSIQQAALLHRSRIETTEVRAMERSMDQLKELTAAIKRNEPSRFERLKLIYATHLMPQWNLRQELARNYMRLGRFNTAREIFEEIHQWEDVITCYNEINLKGQAARIIRQLMKKEKTTKLWCLLGEATDDVECFHTAFEMSGGKSGKAQRCLGNYYYVRKNYQKAIEHYDVSVTINFLQFQVWQRLAYSALQAEDWEKCAKAYGKCSNIEPDCFETWNNLSQAYLKLNQSTRAWNCLEAALRCNRTSWKLWGNYMLVSTNLGYMSQALNAYNCLLALKERHIDTEILGQIVMAVKNNKTDPAGNCMGSLHKKCTQLLARLTNEVPTNGELWFLLGDMVHSKKDGTSESKHLSMKHYRRSVSVAVNIFGWEKTIAQAGLVLMRMFRMLEVVHEVADCDKPQGLLTELNSIRMLVRNVIIPIEKGYTDFVTDEIIPQLNTPVSQAKEQLQKLMELIAKIKAL